MNQHGMVAYCFNIENILEDTNGRFSIGHSRMHDWLSRQDKSYSSNIMLNSQRPHGQLQSDPRQNIF